MRFEIQKNTKRGIEYFERLGVLYHEKNTENKTVTPACTLYTSSGCVPHVTGDLLKYIKNVPNIVEVPLPSIVESRETLMKLKTPIQKLTTLKDNMTILTVKDNSRLIKENRNEGKKLAVWSKRGKSLITTEDYLNLSNDIAIDLAESTFDDFNSGETKKRNRKSFERTKNCNYTFFTEDTIKSKFDKILPIIGYEDMETRKFYLEHIIQSNYNFKAISYHGFNKEDITMELTDFENFKNTVTSINKELGVIIASSSFKIYSYSGRPDQILNAVELGFDVFSGSYPFILTKQNKASLYEWEMDQIAAEHGFEDNIEEPLKRKKLTEISVSNGNGHEANTEVPSKRRKLTDRKISTEQFIDLKDQKYAEDFSKLRESCECYTCQNFTRAYICHLVKVKEISAHTLIMIHNMHNYFGFFEETRRSIDEDYFSEYKTFVSDQFLQTKEEI